MKNMESWMSAGIIVTGNAKAKVVHGDYEKVTIKGLPRVAKEMEKQRELVATVSKTSVQPKEKKEEEDVVLSHSPANQKMIDQIRSMDESTAIKLEIALKGMRETYLKTETEYIEITLKDVTKCKAEEAKAFAKKLKKKAKEIKDKKAVDDMKKQQVFEMFYKMYNEKTSKKRYDDDNDEKGSLSSSENDE